MSSATHTMQLARTGKHFFWNYGPLVFSVFYFFPMIRNYDTYSVSEVVIQFLAYVGFIFCYHKASIKPAKDATNFIALMMLICILMTQETSGTSTLFGYVGYFIGFCFLGTVRWLMLAVLMCAITLVATLHISPNYWPYFIGPAAVISLGLFGFGVVEYKERIHRNESKQSREQIRQLAKIAERERIARDLHDLLGHSLSSISLKSELAGKFIDAGCHDKARHETQEVAELARTALSEVREAVSGMKQLGLRAQLEVMTSRLQDKGLLVEPDIQQVELTPEQESCLCFVAKEAITNVLKHSSADKVSISLGTCEQYHKLTLCDDGEVRKVVWGNGLTGIRSRIEELGGSFTVLTESGLKLVAQLPKKEISR
ncbi:sensor histidine kinase [Pseudoalteromonas luteoviolacea]|uniref:sensor histidine kinase n=1 Tax=Pseudoalteromonas luteoviolacea TaxID=43657 RepID=UPI001B36228D|nr:sensor histidine kinase [Pseudoalteromonas luteoviolacea]MBQ4814476.1 sensor histidine kinase [Pseudoalteromonas luteoviolacea]